MQTRFRTRTRPASHPRPRLIAALRRERQRRLAARARYDRYIAEATGHLALQAFWRNLRRQDEDDAQRLKNWLVREDLDGGPLPGNERETSPGLDGRRTPPQTRPALDP